MNVGPVIQRELRVQARSPVTWRLRMLAVALATGCFGLEAAGSRSYYGYRGQELFATLHGFTVFAILAACPLLTADAISREKREGTLPLLILSSLTPREIVLGKAAAHALRAYLLWLAAVPVLCLPLLLGGIPVSTVLLILGIEAALIAVGLSSGMSASAMSERSGMAVLAAYGVLAMTSFVGIFVVPVAAALLSGAPGTLGLFLAFVVIVAATALAVVVHIVSAAADISDFSRRWQVGSSQYYFPPSPVEVARPAPTPGPEAGSQTTKPAQPVTPSAESRSDGWVRPRRDPLLERRPIEWLFCRSHGEHSREHFAGLWMLFVGYFAFMTLVGSGNPEWIMVPLIVSMTIAAARNLHDEKQNGMLDLLFILPGLGNQLVCGQLGRCRRVFLPPLLLCAICSWGFDLYHGEPLITPTLVLGFTSLFVLPVTGLWVALMARRAIAVFLGTVALAWGMPFVAMAAADFIFARLLHSERPEAVETLTFIVYLGVHIAVGVVSWFLAVRACRRYPESLAFGT